MITSPCINICQMNAATGLCQGCLRTLDEIAAWSRVDDPARLAILARIAGRRAEHTAPQGDLPRDRNPDE